MAMESDSSDDETPKEPEIPTNIRYAQLKFEAEQSKELANAAKASGDSDLQKKHTARTRELKSQMDELSKRRDYNPRLANEEWKKMVKEEAEKGGSSKKAKFKTQQTDNGGDDGDMIGGLFEAAEAEASKPSGAKKDKGGKATKLRDMTYTNWSGKSPKQLCMDWLAKNARGARAQFYPIHGGPGNRWGVRLKGGGKEFDGKVAEMEQHERTVTAKEAEHFVATRLLYLLVPKLPLYRSLPPPYRDLWQELQTVEKKIAEIEKKGATDERAQFLTKLIEERDRRVKALKQKSPESDQQRGENEEREIGEGLGSLMSGLSLRGGEKSKGDMKRVSMELEEELKRRRETGAVRELLVGISKRSFVYVVQQRSSLPVYAKRKDILDLVAKNQVVIVSGETGSGKSTQVPQFFVEDAIERGKGGFCNVICTQPRRISAISIASRVSEEMGDGFNEGAAGSKGSGRGGKRGAGQEGGVGAVGALGSWVGYSIRLESKTSKTTRLTFCTTGVLLRRLETDRALQGVSHIVVDEVLGGGEYNVSDSSPPSPTTTSACRIILMSATADAQRFSNYFAEAGLGACPCITVPGRTFPVVTHFLEDAIEQTGYIVEDGSEYAVRGTAHMRETGPMRISGKGGKQYTVKLQWEESDSDSDSDEGAILLDDNTESSEQESGSGKSYSSSTLRTIKKLDPQKLNFDLIERVILQICDEGQDGDREEDNIGVDDDAFASRANAILVFLPGFMEIRRLYDRLMALSAERKRGEERRRWLVIPLHSTLGSEEQKKVFKLPPPGVRKIVLSTNIAETGITIPDVVYVIDTCRAREVSRKTFNVLPDHRPPEMVRLPLEELCLRVRATGYTQPLAEFLSEAPDPPPARNIERSIDALKQVQALDACEQLTSLGEKLANMPMDVRLGKMLLYGVALRCLDPILTIAAILSLGRSPFSRPFGKEAEADRAKAAFRTADSDLLTMYTAYDRWRSCLQNASTRSPTSVARDFCDRNYLSMQNLMMIEEGRGQLLRLLAGAGMVDRNVLRESPDVKSQSGRKAPLIQTYIPDAYNKNQKHVMTLAALAAGLYPNIMHIVNSSDFSNLASSIGGGTNGPVLGSTAAATTSGFGSFTLRSPGSTELIYVHPRSSYNSEGVIYKKPGWFVYYEMARSGASKRLMAWDVNRASVIALAALAGGEIKVEHRQRVFTFDNVRLRCPPRTASALQQFSQHLRQAIDLRMGLEMRQQSTEADSSKPKSKGQIDVEQADKIIDQLFQDMLVSEGKGWGFESN
ncbi:ATP-dependent RNA helicase dhx29 [Quaeritorhiza haematococci]|nr:ATP-dependent RNA helicase dhx29 [Quaeritorhiza haematococci]